METTALIAGTTVSFQEEKGKITVKYIPNPSVNTDHYFREIEKEIKRLYGEFVGLVWLVDTETIGGLVGYYKKQ